MDLNQENQTQAKLEERDRRFYCCWDFDQYFSSVAHDSFASESPKGLVKNADSSNPYLLNQNVPLSLAGTFYGKCIPA